MTHPRLRNRHLAGSFARGTIELRYLLDLSLPRPTPSPMRPGARLPWASGALLPKTRNVGVHSKNCPARLKLRRLQRLDTSGGFDQRSPICARRGRDIKNSQRLAPFGVGVLSCAVCTGMQLTLPNTGTTQQFKGFWLPEKIPPEWRFQSRLRCDWSGQPQKALCILEATTSGALLQGGFW